MASVIHHVALTCHPQTPTDVVRAVGARVPRPADGRLMLTFALDADVARLRIPSPAPARPVHGLWKHTCFEAFVASGTAAGYHELNVAPSSEWMIYAFAAYREIAPMPDDLPQPEVTVRRSRDRLELDATLRLDSLSGAYANAPLRLALAAVIEDERGGLSYWALRHPPGKADFHHADAFVLGV